MHTTKSKITYNSLISVIIPTYNRKAMCLSAVESVLAQLKVNVEIIVVDDGSSDGTKEYLTHVFDKITYIFQSNQGVSIARNNGLNVAKGAYIAFLDSDDTFTTSHLYDSFNVLADDETKDLVFSKVLRGEHPNKSDVSFLENKFILGVGEYKKNMRLGDPRE